MFQRPNSLDRSYRDPASDSVTWVPSVGGTVHPTLYDPSTLPSQVRGRLTVTAIEGCDLTVGKQVFVKLFLGDQQFRTGVLAVHVPGAASAKGAATHSNTFTYDGGVGQQVVVCKLKGANKMGTSAEFGRADIPMRQLLCTLQPPLPHNDAGKGSLNKTTAAEECKVISDAIAKASCLSAHVKSTLSRIVDGVVNSAATHTHEAWVPIADTSGGGVGKVRLRFVFELDLTVPHPLIATNPPPNPQAQPRRSKTKNMSLKSKNPLGGLMSGAASVASSITKSAAAGYSSLLEKSQNRQPSDGGLNSNDRESSLSRAPAKFFGSTLEEAFENSDGDVPYPVVDCVEFLEKYALKEQGLFRVAGSKQDVEGHIIAYENDSHIKFDPASPHECSGVLKAFFRQLLDPVIPYFLYPAFIATAENQEKNTHHQNNEVYTSLIQQLPFENQTILQYLFKHLQKVIGMSETNKMTVANIAIVFAPNLLRPEVDDPMTMMKDSKAVNAAVQYLITYEDELFAKDALTSAPPPLPPTRAGSKIAPPPPLPSTSVSSGYQREPPAPLPIPREFSSCIGPPPPPLPLKAAPPPLAFAARHSAPALARVKSVKDRMKAFQN